MLYLCRELRSSGNRKNSNQGIYFLQQEVQVLLLYFTFYATFPLQHSLMLNIQPHIISTLGSTSTAACVAGYPELHSVTLIT